MNKYFVGISILGIIFVVSGCLPSVPKVWTKPGLTQQEFEADKTACMYDVNKATVGTYGFESGWLMGQCMKTKGYTPVQ